MVSFLIDVINEAIEFLDVTSNFEIRAPSLVSDCSPGPTVTSSAYTL